MPPRYSEWLKHVFDHEVSIPQWHFDVNSLYFEATDLEITELITWTNNHCGTDLLSFSDGQVGQGISYIFDGSCSNHAHSIRDGAFPLEIKITAIHSIARLYSDCFAKRCSQDVRSSKVLSPPLSHICYMLWDVTCLNYWEGIPDRVQGYEAVVDVLASALSIKNAACIESALHGLGHTLMYHTDRCKRVIANFILKNPDLEPGLLEYAEDAMTGYIQ